MSETNLGLHRQVDCSRCVDQRRRTFCYQMTSACAVRGASHWQWQLILIPGRRSTLGWHGTGTPEHGHQRIYAPELPVCMSPVAESVSTVHIII